jgi:hypothetical protein
MLILKANEEKINKTKIIRHLCCDTVNTKKLVIDYADIKCCLLKLKQIQKEQFNLQQ